MPDTHHHVAHTQEFHIPYLPQKAQLLTYTDGYKLLFVPKAGNVFNINTWVKTGSIHEDEQNNGVSHFLEHLMFKGTHRFQPGEFDRAMESMGALINAATWKDFTFYYITGPNDPDGHNFSRALDMHADMLLHSTLPEAEVGPPYDADDPDYAGEKRERSVVIEEIGMRQDQPWTRVYNAVNHMMYPEGHPYRRDVIGTRQIIGRIPRTDILHYYHTWYSPAQLCTVVVGDFNLDVLAPLVRQHFDFSEEDFRDLLPEGERTPQPSWLPEAWAYPQPQALLEQLEGDVQTSFLMLGFHGPKPENLVETVALDVASYILGEGRSARLPQALVEQPENPVFTQASSGQSVFKLGNVFFIQANYHSLSPHDTLFELWSEINAFLTTQPITPEEFCRAVKKLKVDLAETSETASGLGETLGESITVTGSLDYALEYPKILEQLDLQTVQTVAQHYISKEQAYTAVLVPKT